MTAWTEDPARADPARDGPTQPGLRIGAVFFPAGSAAEVAAQWREGEALRLCHGWTYDHHRWSGSRSEAGFWPAAVPMLALACLATTRMTVGTLVSPPTRRTPADAAHTAATLNRLSGGRFVLGLGAGVPGPDEQLTGQSVASGADRQRRFAEYVDLTVPLLRGQHVDVAGAFYRATGSLPAAVAGAGPQVAVAGHTATAADLAARWADLWVSNGPAPFRHDGADLDLDQVRRVCRRVEESCERIGRPPRTLRRLFVLVPRRASRLADSGYVTDLAHELHSAGYTELVYPFPCAGTPYLASMVALTALVDAFPAGEMGDCASPRSSRTPPGGHLRSAGDRR